MSQLQAERNALRVTQADAAGRMGVNPDTFRRWERTDKMPEPMLRLWARVAMEIAAETYEAAKRIREGIEE